MPPLSPVVKIFIRSKVTAAFKNALLSLMAYIPRNPADQHEFGQMICKAKKRLIYWLKILFLKYIIISDERHKIVGQYVNLSHYSPHYA